MSKIFYTRNTDIKCRFYIQASTKPLWKVCLVIQKRMPQCQLFCVYLYFMSFRFNFNYVSCAIQKNIIIDHILYNPVCQEDYEREGDQAAWVICASFCITGTLKLGKAKGLPRIYPVVRLKNWILEAIIEPGPEPWSSMQCEIQELCSNVKQTNPQFTTCSLFLHYWRKREGCRLNMPLQLQLHRMVLRTFQLAAAHTALPLFSPQTIQFKCIQI